MPRAPRSLLIGLFMLLCGGLAAERAAAAPQRLGRRQAQQVERLVSEAKTLKEAGKLLEAAAVLRQALDIFPAPWLVFNLARLYEDAGDLPTAKSYYDQVLTQKPDAETAERTRQRLAEVEQRLQNGEIVLMVEPEGAEVFVDEQSVGRAPLEPLTLPVGRHTLRAAMPGFASAEVVVTVSGGQRIEQGLRLQPAPAVPAGPDAELAGRGGHRTPRWVRSPWPWVTLATGVAAAAAGGALYGVAAGERAELKDGLDDQAGGRVVGISQKRAYALRDGAATKEVSAYALWGVAGAATAASVVLMAVLASREGSADSAADTPVTTTFVVGPAGFGVVGRF